MYRVLRLLLSATLGAIVLSACASTPIPTTTSSEEALPPGPEEGIPMAWVDGSTLIFIPDPDGIDYYGSRGFWITFRPISNYQFSLCVQSGLCKPPEGEGYNDPEKLMDFFSISDSTIADPDHSGGYCDWMFGRNPTDHELDLFLNSVGEGLPKNGEISFEDIGLMSGGEFGIQVDTIHCIVDNPTPHPMYLQTTPYYNLDVNPEDMEAQVTRSETFCQNGYSYQTLDLYLPENHSIESVKSEGETKCEILENNRVVCYSPSNISNPQQQVEGAIPCNALDVFSCQPGSSLEGGVCSGQSNGNRIDGLQDWKLDENGILFPVNGHQLSNGAWVGEITQPVLWINGTFVIQDTQASSLPADQGDNILVSFPNPNSIRQQGIIPSVSFGYHSLCPTGYYGSRTDGLCSGGLTSSDLLWGGSGSGGGSQSQTTCMRGYHYNTQTMRCESDQPIFNYPGCPTGKLMFLQNGRCDLRTFIVSASQIIHSQDFDLELQDCSVPESSQGNGNDSGGLVCKAGETLVCPDPKDPKSCYCK